MQLHVTVRLPSGEEEPIEQVISSFDDIDRLGARVASATRRWLRSVQVRKGVQHTEVGLAAYFVEGEGVAAAEVTPSNGHPSPKRRRRKKAS
jgi:hypothetical protein